MRILVPNQILKSVLDIDFAHLKQLNICGLLIDLDNTIVGWEKSQLDTVFLNWVQTAQKQGMKLCLVSNAVPRRVRNFARQLQIPAISKAFKPRKRAFTRGLDLLNLPADQVAVVGDQLFTDIYGGNRLGLHTILINPLSTEELRSTKYVRKIEQRMMASMAKKGLVSPHSIEIRRGRS